MFISQLMGAIRRGGDQAEEAAPLPDGASAASVTFWFKPVNVLCQPAKHASGLNNPPHSRKKYFDAE